MGGRLLELKTSDGQDILVPTKPHSFNATDWPRAGAYPLIPYHNRLSNAGISVDQRVVSLAANPAALPHTLHESSHTRPWTLFSHDSCRIVMKLDYEPDGHWPWRFKAVQDFELSGSDLKLSISLTNRSESPMPAGLGWHPYLSSLEPVSTDAKFVWHHAEDYLPTGGRDEVRNEQAESTLPTRYLEGWSEARVNLIGRGSATISASPEFGFLVIHRGHSSHICVEPVTHVPNAWNLNVDRDRVGARILRPGETLKGSILLRVSL
ncbi:hypothetical protein [Brucella intermedia]|uniref:aldose epimerase family protein n=1 Tax=Brucella intermedia TaxID=94625 RepID=UPI003B638A7B